MSPSEKKVEEKKVIRKERLVVSGWLLLILAVSFTISRYSVEIMSLLSGLPPEEIGDKGIEPLQSVMIAMYKLPMAIVFCAAMASFVERQLKPDAFGSLSRWGVIFCLLLFCFVQLAAR